MRLSLPFFLLCGALAGWLLSGVVPSGLHDDLHDNLHGQPWRMDRPSDDPLEITESRWLFLPYLFGDFDLQMDLSLSEGAELDVLVRQVEPRTIGEREHRKQFAARWSALRLSTEGGGEGWLTREQALFGPTGTGVALAPGHTATVWIEARGRMVRANVAGKKLPWFEADDRYGMLTMLIKGGNAVVHRLEIEALPVALWPWSPWAWIGFGVLGAAIVGLLLPRLTSHWHLLPCGIALPCIAWLLSRQVDLELGLPDPLGMGMLLGAFLLFASLFALKERNLAFWLLALSVFALLWFGMPRLAWDHERVDQAFGEQAGNQITEAHGQLVRGPLGLHSLDMEGDRVFLLGGKVLYGLGAPGEHVAVQLATQLRARLRRQIQVPCLPTGDAEVAQQWQLFERFYLGYQPRVVVLGVDRVAPEASLPDLVATVREACRERGSRLVLFAVDAIGKERLDELRAEEARGTPLRICGFETSQQEKARLLADVIEQELRK